jgi:hypothetical protein
LAWISGVLRKIPASPNTGGKWGTLPILFGQIKNAAWAGRVRFCLYFYFIKLGEVNRTRFWKYFPNWDKGLAGIGVVWGLDRIWAGIKFFGR